MHLGCDCSYDLTVSRGSGCSSSIVSDEDNSYTTSRDRSSNGLEDSNSAMLRKQVCALLLVPCEPVNAPHPPMHCCVCCCKHTPSGSGIDGSARMAAFASRIAIRNGLSSQFGGPLTIVSGKVEALEQLPGGVEKVQISPPSPPPHHVPSWQPISLDKEGAFTRPRSS